MTATPHIQDFQLGLHGTNCYVVSDSDAPGAGAWLVDVGYEPAAMLEYVAQHELDVKMIVLTHAHLDHVGGLWEARQFLGADGQPDVPIVIHEAEREFLTDSALNLSAYAGPPFQPFVGPDPDDVLHAGDRLNLGALQFEVRHVPGHSPGNVALVNTRCDPPVALVGDALFAGSVGRTDFPTSDHDTLMRSIREQLYTLPDSTRVLSGHGPETTIGEEKANSPFCRA